jgi:aquaporin Z
MASELGKQCLGEFIGTYLLILTVGFNVLSGQSTWAVLSIASVLMVSIYALASVSGANFNPAVTLTLYLTKAETDLTKVGAYMATQIVAGICAGMTSLAVFGDAIPLQPGKGHGVAGAAAVEILYTFVLVFVVLRGAVIAEKDNESFGMAIAFSVVAGGYAGGSISGGCFNPAVAIGLDVSSAHLNGAYWCWLYTLFEFIGAGLAVGIHMFLQTSESEMAKKCLSEFLGTFVLVATVGLNVLGGGNALSIGASLMVMIYALGGVSGANFNPAVTTTLALTKKLEMKWVAPYMASQIAGGLAAAFFYYGIHGKAFPLGPGKKASGDAYGWGAVGFAEIMYTFVLCFVVLNVACLNDKSAKGEKLYLMTGGPASQMYGLAIGFCIVVGGNAIGGVSGGSLNPAVSIGLDTVGSIDKDGVYFTNSLVYSCFELIGAGVAAGAFYALREEQFPKEGSQKLKKDDPEQNYGSM